MRKTEPLQRDAELLAETLIAIAGKVKHAEQEAFQDEISIERLMTENKQLSEKIKSLEHYLQDANNRILKDYENHKKDFMMQHEEIKQLKERHAADKQAWYDEGGRNHGTILGLKANIENLQQLYHKQINLSRQFLEELQLAKKIIRKHKFTAEFNKLKREQAK